MQALARVLAATFVLSSFSAAQQPSSDAKQDPLQVTAKLIVVPTVVRDKHGALIKDLTRDSFDLKVDGKPQTVRYFDHDSDVPLTVGLLIDTSMSQREVLGDEQAASAAFLDKMLTPDRDKAFLIQFAADVNLLQDITDSRPKLQEALKQIDGDKPQFGRGHDHSAGMGTTLYDSVFLASDEVLSKQQGRRALILLTDGDDRGSLKTLPKAIEAAQRADTIVYAIYYHSDHDFGGGYGGHHDHGGGYPGGGGHGGYPGGGGGGYPGGGHDHADGKKVLEQMCHETGGQMFEVKGKETVNKIYAEIGDELRSQYRLGFTPSAEAASAGYHQIDLTLTGAAAKGKNQVQTRDGYYQR